MDLLRSLPLGLYLEQPVTWLHKLDSRVKLAWLMSFLGAPILANAGYRILLVVLLILITLMAWIPLRVWQQQMGWLLMLSGFVLLIAAISPDGMGITSQPRLPAQELAFVQPSRTTNDNVGAIQSHPWYNPLGWWQKSPTPVPKSNPLEVSTPKSTQYGYVLFQQGPFTVTRRSLDLGVRVSTLIFTLIYSTNLFLLTTAPEEITAGLETLMRPLRRLNWPVTEIALTLTLSLRFIPLVLEEIQNLVRSVRTRAINWKKLGLRGGIRVWMLVAERLLTNLLLRAEQMAYAMQVRGFTSPNTHRVQWQQLRLQFRDGFALVVLVALWVVRFCLGNDS